MPLALPWMQPWVLSRTLLWTQPWSLSRALTCTLFWVLLCVFLFAIPGGRFAEAQPIPFQNFIPENDENYALELAPLGGNEDLDFGLVIMGQGLTEIELNSDDVAILTIEGVRYFDVFVSVDAPGFIYLDGVVTGDANKRIPLTVQAAYANRGSDNTGPGFRIPFAGTTARFPIFRRGSGPPGPPPTPPHSGYVPPRETAYLFIYGSIDVQTGLLAGSYESTITIEVSYDDI